MFLTIVIGCGTFWVKKKQKTQRIAESIIETNLLAQCRPLLDEEKPTQQL